MKDRQQKGLIIIVGILSVIVLAIAGSLVYYLFFQGKTIIGDTSVSYAGADSVREGEVTVSENEPGDAEETAAALTESREDSAESTSQSGMDSTAAESTSQSGMDSTAAESTSQSGMESAAAESTPQSDTESAAESTPQSGTDSAAAESTPQSSTESAAAESTPQSGSDSAAAESSAANAADTAKEVESSADAATVGSAAESGTDSAASEDLKTESPTEAPSDAPFDAKAELLRSKTDDAFWVGCPARDIELLTPNEYSRPQTALDTVNNLVIHYVGNAGSSAMDNRNYFESLKDSHERSASSHFVIGLSGEIVQCIPISEIAYASKNRNNDTISIECCHPGDDGQFNEYTYWSLVELSAWLCKKFHLNPQEILRHYDVTEKLCPLYYVEHPDEWQTLKDTIERRMYEIS